MKTNVYSIRDRLDGFYRPFCANSDALAKRDFAASVNNSRSDSALAFSPADYDLYKLGVFDSESGLLTPEDVPIFICKGSDLVGS